MNLMSILANSASTCVVLALCYNLPKVLVLDNRRDPLTCSMIGDYLTCILTCLYELRLYSLHLQSSPAQEAALLVESPEHPKLSCTQVEIMDRMRETWSMILELEAKEDTHRMLKASCAHTRFFCFRETMTLMEEEGWELNQRTRALLSSWHPGLSMSANVEQIFNRMEDSAKRASKNAGSSLPNLQCLAIRSVNHQIARGEKGCRPVNLSTEDFEGKQIRNIRASVWRPESLSGGALAFMLQTCASHDDSYRLRPPTKPMASHVRFLCPNTFIALLALYIHLKKAHNDMSMLHTTIVPKN